MSIKLIGTGLGVAFTGSSFGALVTDGFGCWKTIPWQPLSKDGGYYSGGTIVKTDYQDKFGGKYGKYLTGLDQANEEFWNYKYDLWKEDNVTSGKFKSGSISDLESLKNICGEAYKKSENDLKPDTPAPADQDFKKSDVWRYCSKGTTQPKTVNDVESEKYDDETGNLGETKKTKLLSIREPDNQWVWDLKNEEFFSDASLKTGEGHFQQFYKVNSSNRARGLKDACFDAYKKKENKEAGTVQLIETEVIKWCSLEGK